MQHRGPARDDRHAQRMRHARRLAQPDETQHGGNDPDAAGAKALAAKCLERGLLILTCGVYSDTVRMLTPLTASEMVIKEGLDILESALLGN